MAAKVTALQDPDALAPLPADQGRLTGELAKRLDRLEKRLADAEQGANDNELKAIGYRKDVIKLGEQLEKDRHESIRRLGLVSADGNDKINKVVIVLEKLATDFGRQPEQSQTSIWRH